MSVESLWRLSRRMYQRGYPRLAKTVKAFNFFAFSAVLATQAEVGERLRLGHHGLGVVVHPNVTLGSDVLIWQHVTLAAETSPGSPYRIHVGDGVEIGAGATLVGRGERHLRIGAGAQIGAGAVVTRDVAPGQTVVGVPARPAGQPAAARLPA